MQMPSREIMSAELKILHLVRSRIMSHEKERRSRFTQGAKVADQGPAIRPW